MRLPPWPTLIAVAGGCGIGVGCMALMVFKERDRLTNQAGFIAKAVHMLQEQPVTRELLGEELKIGKASLGDGWSQADKFNVKVRVPVKGEKDNAYLYAYARRQSEGERYRLYKLEATFSSVKGKKLLIMDRSDQEDQPEEEREFVVAKAKQKEPEPPKELSAEEKRRKYIEDMKNWEPKK